MASVDDTVEIVESYIKSCKSFLSAQLDSSKSLTPGSREHINTRPRSVLRRADLTPRAMDDIYVNTSRPRRSILHAAGEPSPFATPNGSIPATCSTFKENTFNKTFTEPSEMDISVVTEQAVVEKSVELPILKKAKEMFEFPKNSKKEFLMTGIVQLFCLVFSIMTHPKTRYILMNTIKFTFDVLFALILVAFSVLLSLITVGEEFARKKIDEHKKVKQEPSTG